MFRKATFAALLVAASSSSAFAITAGEVMDKMSKEERFSYLSGLVDMHSYHSILAGKKDHAKCIIDKFYDDKDVTLRVYAALMKFPDKAPESILVLIMRQECKE
jgi:hypothetical protein